MILRTWPENVKSKYKKYSGPKFLHFIQIKYTKIKENSIIYLNMVGMNDLSQNSSEKIIKKTLVIKIVIFLI